MTELAERERWQAQLISLQFAHGTASALHGLSWTVYNDSPTVVQNVQAFYVAQGVVHAVVGAGRVKTIARGGQWEAQAQPRFGPEVMANLRLQNIGITFQDNSGRWWGRWADGDLRPLGADRNKDLIEHAFNP